MLNHPFNCIVIFFHFSLASFKYETIPYAIPHVSSTNFYRACFHIVHGKPIINKPLYEFHLHCCLVLELDCLYNNTSFWLSLSTCEITYYLSTPSKQVRPLITLSINHPKPTKWLDALSQGLELRRSPSSSPPRSPTRHGFRIMTKSSLSSSLSRYKKGLICHLRLGPRRVSWA